MKIRDNFCLSAGGKAHGNAHDRRRKPTAKERRRLARRWRRSAEDRRACLLKREAHNTWTGRVTGWPRIESVEIGAPIVRHAVQNVTNPWTLANALRSLDYGTLNAWASITVGSDHDHVIVKARNYGVPLTFTSTPGLEWTEVVRATSGAADRMPAPYKITGRKSQ